MSGTNGAISNDVSADENLNTAGDESHNDESRAQESARKPLDRDDALSAIARQHNALHGIPADPAGDDGQGDDDAGKKDDDAAGQDTDNDDDQANDDGQQNNDDAGNAGDDNDTLQPEGAAQDDPLTELGYYRKDDGKLYAKMKINGVEKEVPAAQVRAYIQKDIAGDHKLQQAWEREQELNEREENLNRLSKQFDQSLSQPPKNKGADEYLQDAKAILDTIWDGSTEESAQKLAEVLQRQNEKPTVDADQIVQTTLSQIEQREATRERENREREEQDSIMRGRQKIQDQYPELLEDDVLFNFVDSETARMVELKEKGDPDYIDLTPEQILVQAAQTVKERISQPAKPQSSNSNSSREKNKGNLKPIPSQQSRAANTGKKQEIDLSPTAVVARMKAARQV